MPLVSMRGLNSHLAFTVRVILVGILWFGLAACGRHTKIQLKNENLDTNPPKTPVPKPGDGLDPSGGDASAETGYRIFCDASGDGLGSFTTGSLEASSVTPRIALTVSDVAKPQALIVSIRQLVALNSLQFYRGFAVFEGETIERANAGKTSRQIYLGEVDVASREIRAHALARATEADKAALDLAGRLGVELRSFGISSRGTWVIVPREDRWLLQRVDDLSVVGTIHRPAGKSFFPALNEETGLFSFTEHVKDRFENRLIRLAVHTSVPTTIVENLRIPAPPSSWTALPMEVAGESFAWIERPVAAPETGIALSIMHQTDTESVSRFTVSGLNLAKSSTLHKIQAEEFAVVVAHESASQVMMLRPAPAGSLEKVMEWSYPHQDSRLTGFTVSSDLAKWTATFVRKSGRSALYRPLAEELIGIGHGTCQAPALVQEEL